MAQSESTIATAKILDMDTLMSEGFSVDSILDGPDSERFRTMSELTDPKELDADLKMSAFLQNIGVSGKDNQAANKTAASSILNTTSSVGLWDSVKEGWNNNLIQIRIGDIRLSERMREITPVQAQSQVSALKAQMRTTKAKGLASWAKSAANIAPMMIETSAEGAKYGLVTGGAAAGITALAQTSTVVSAPLEPITVPGAALTFGTIGFAYGSANRTRELETGLMYDELLEFTDAQGNKIDPAIAGPIADSVGTINALLDLAQIGDIIKTIPGGKKLLAKAMNKTIKNLVQSKSVLKILAKDAVRYAGHVGIESGVEVLQETDNIIFGELAKNISNELDKTGFAPAAKKDITKRLVDTAIESAKGFSLIAGPGNVIQTGGEVLAAKATPTKAVEGQTPVGAIQTTLPGTELVGRISRVMASEKIIPRLDINSLGKTMVDIPTELPAKKRKAVKEVEAVLTPEEEYALQQSEATMKAEEPFTITPELYIGNVTQRMKKVFAEEWNTEPEQIHGFTEGAWPTKRTKIELKMDEGRALLIHLENSLQDRVDNNKLNTDSDLARANADWGDIKELRHKLGLPKTLRPFRVIRAKKQQIIVIKNTRERIEKTTKAGAQDVVQTLEIDRLNTVMQRVAKAAKEGWVGGKKQAREQYALLQYLRKQKQLRDKLVEKINAEPSKNVDFFYREAIKGLQSAIDWGITTEGKKEQKDALKALLKKNPEKATEIPAELLETLNKKDVDSLSYNDLLVLNEEVNRLKQIGKLKSELYHKQRRKAIETETKEMTATIGKATKNLMPSVERANALRPTRIFDMLDGGKKFAGRIFNFFYKQTNEDYNAELQNIDNRQTAMKRRREELGISFWALSRKRAVGEFNLTVDEMLSIYAGWKNPASRAALRYGGIPKKIKGKEIYVELTDEIYNKIEAELTENEKIWGDTIIAEYDQHYNRMRNTVIAAENRDPGNEVNYTKIRRKGIQFVSTEQELLDELAVRDFFRTVEPEKRFTIKRKDIPAEYQKPIELGLTKIWMQESRKQEHYINNALHIKDMQAIVKEENFRESIRERFGGPVLDTVDHFVKSIANPDFYKTFSDIEQISKIARRHTAIAYIAFRLTSILKQIPQLMMYWAKSSAVDMLMSAMDATFHPMQAYEKAKGIHYQISHITIEREMEELQRADENLYKKIINTIGTTGMYGIFAIDRASRVIGINAVYNKAIRDGMSPTEAADKASMTTLLTQEASSPKDLAKLYSSNEILNWFTMFTNELNQIYNITTYDIPVAFRNKNYREATRSAIALATSAMMIWMIQNNDVPDEPEDAAQALAEQLVSSWPLIGSYLVSGAKGWSAQAPPPLKAATSVGKAAARAVEGDYEKMLYNLTEPLAIGTGFPYQAAKEIYNFIEEID